MTIINYSVFWISPEMIGRFIIEIDFFENVLVDVYYHNYRNYRRVLERWRRSELFISLIEVGRDVFFFRFVLLCECWSFSTIVEWRRGADWIDWSHYPQPVKCDVANKVGSFRRPESVELERISRYPGHCCYRFICLAWFVCLWHFTHKIWLKTVFFLLYN